MNEHAKSIWIEWMNGSTVQYWEEGPETWIDLHPPLVCELIRPESEPHKWRISPCTKRNIVSRMPAFVEFALEEYFNTLA